MWMKQGRHSHSLSQQAGGTERSRFSARNVGAQMPLPSFSFPLTLQYSVGFLSSPSAALHREAQLWDPCTPRVQRVIRGKCGMAAAGRGKGAGAGCPPESPCSSDCAVNSCWLGSCESIIPRMSSCAKRAGYPCDSGCWGTAGGFPGVMCSCHFHAFLG